MKPCYHGLHDSDCDGGSIDCGGRALSIAEEQVAWLEATNAALLAALEESEIHYVPKGCEYQPLGKSCADTPSFAPCSPCNIRAAIRAAKGESA